MGWRWLSHAMSKARSVSGQYLSSTISTSRTVSMTISGVSLRSQPPQRCRGPTGACVLTSCATSPLLSTCRPLFSQQLLHLTHRWWSETEGPVTEEGDVHSLAAAAHICLKLHSAKYPDLVPFQLPDHRQPARPLTDLLRAASAYRSGCA